LKQQAGQVDPIQVRCERSGLASARILEQDFGQPDDGRDRSAEFLSHESGQGTF
jgi:hypothetical protein